jgi:hypothetical protein
MLKLTTPSRSDNTGSPSRSTAPMSMSPLTRSNTCTRSPNTSKRLLRRPHHHHHKLHPRTIRTTRILTLLGLDLVPRTIRHLQVPRQILPPTRLHPTLMLNLFSTATTNTEASIPLPTLLGVTTLLRTPRPMLQAVFLPTLAVHFPSFQSSDHRQAHTVKTWLPDTAVSQIPSRPGTTKSPTMTSTILATLMLPVTSPKSSGLDLPKSVALGSAAMVKMVLRDTT